MPANQDSSIQAYEQACLAYKQELSKKLVRALRSLNDIDIHRDINEYYFLPLKKKM